MSRIILIKDYLLQSPICHSFPHRLGIETTARCNLQCKMCPRTLALKRPTKDMNLKTFRNIMEQIEGKVEFISLQEYGEPLMNLNIFKMITIAKNYNIKTGLSTNATLLSKETSYKLIQAGLDYLIFAFDGATKKTYEKIRKGAKYEMVQRNIKNFLEIKNKLQSKIFVVVQCIYMKETANEIADFKKQWWIKGVDALRIRQITQGISQYDQETKKKLTNKQNVPCYWLWTEPAIFWDGTVVPCCQDVNADIVLGNINTENLLNIWNSAQMQHLRRLHKKGKRDKIPICKDCNMYQPSLPLAIGSSFFNVFTLNKIIPWVESFISSIRYR